MFYRNFTVSFIRGFCLILQVVLDDQIDHRR